MSTGLGRHGRSRLERLSRHDARGNSKHVATLALVLLAASTEVQAEPVADFYKGKTLRMVVGYSPGGGYDIYGRLAAEFLGRHIPGNPSIIVVNMPGSGSLKAIDYLYKSLRRTARISAASCSRWR